MLSSDRKFREDLEGRKLKVKMSDVKIGVNDLNETQIARILTLNDLTSAQAIKGKHTIFELSLRSLYDEVVESLEAMHIADLYDEEKKASRKRKEMAETPDPESDANRRRPRRRANPSSSGT